MIRWYANRTRPAEKKEMEAFSPLVIFWQKYLPEKKATQGEKSTSRDFDGDQDKRRQMMKRHVDTTAKISLFFKGALKYFLR